MGWFVGVRPHRSHLQFGGTASVKEFLGDGELRGQSCLIVDVRLVKLRACLGNTLCQVVRHVSGGQRREREVQRVQRKHLDGGGCSEMVIRDLHHNIASRIDIKAIGSGTKCFSW